MGRPGSTHHCGTQRLPTPGRRWLPACLFVATPRPLLSPAPPVCVPTRVRRGGGSTSFKAITRLPPATPWVAKLNEMSTPAPWRYSFGAPPLVPQGSARQNRPRSSSPSESVRSPPTVEGGANITAGALQQTTNAPVQSDHEHARAPLSPPQSATQALPATNTLSAASVRRRTSKRATSGSSCRLHGGPQTDAERRF